MLLLESLGLVIFFALVLSSKVIFKIWTWSFGKKFQKAVWER